MDSENRDLFMNCFKYYLLKHVLCALKKRLPEMFFYQHETYLIGKKLIIFIFGVIYSYYLPPIVRTFDTLKKISTP